MTWFQFYNKLAWEPSIFTPAVYLCWVVNYDFCYFSLNLESQSQTKNIPLVLPSFPVKIWGKSVKGFLSFDRTRRQTEITTFLYI